MAKQFSMDERYSMIRRCTRGFTSYWQHAYPVPVDPVVDLYRRSVPDTVWFAVRYLIQERKSFVAAQDYFEFKHDGLQIVFLLSGTSLPNILLAMKDLNKLPHSIRSSFIEWVNNIQYYRRLTRAFEERIHGALGNPQGRDRDRSQYRLSMDLDPKVNTAPQLYRLWPELLPWFDDDQKAEVRASSVRSRLPSKVGYEVPFDRHSEWATPARFQCRDPKTPIKEQKEFAAINETLLAASLVKDVGVDPKFPSFYGNTAPLPYT
jgi:hypothetical protein